MSTQLPELLKDAAGSANAGVAVGVTLFGYTLGDIYAIVGLVFLILQLIRFFRQGGIHGSKRKDSKHDSRSPSTEDAGHAEER